MKDRLADKLAPDTHSWVEVMMDVIERETGRVAWQCRAFKCVKCGLISSTKWLHGEDTDRKCGKEQGE